MRSVRSVGLFAVVGFALSMPVLLRAQFQEPTQDELKMTADPQAPGAAAVYLNRDEATDDFNHFYSYYARVKVLAEKGKELATIHIPYRHGFDTVTDIQGRTIHADGTVIPLTSKPSDLMDYKGKNFQVNMVVFTLPAVEVGSILEYRLKVRSPDNTVSQPMWDVQLPFFIHKEHLSFHPFVLPGSYITDPSGQAQTRLMYSQHLGPAMKLNHDERTDTYFLDLKDVPEVPHDDWMPPLNTIRWRVEFYYTNAMTTGGFWEDSGKRWVEWTEEFTHPTNGLRSAAAGLVASGDSDEVKAKKIYAAVQKLENTSFSRAKSEEEKKAEKIRDVHNAEDVWKQEGGSANQIALLFIGLARAAGLKVYAAQVVNRDRAIFDTTYLTVRQLDNYLAIVVLDGKEVYLDPGQKMCPFGILHWKHTLASGFRMTDSGPAPVATPAGSYKASVTQRVGQLFLDPAGVVTGSVRFIYSGQGALNWRQATLRSDADEVKKQFNEAIKEDFPEGVDAGLDHFLSLDDYNTNLIAVVKVTGNVGTMTGKRMFLPGLFFQSRGKHPFAVQETRTTPIDVHYPLTQEDDVTFHFPAGFTMEAGPQATSAAWPDHAVLKISTEAAGDSVDVVRTLVYAYTLLEPADYGKLHDFYQKVAAADQQQLVLDRAAAAAGN